MENNSSQSNVGYTTFKPTRVRHEFPKVDLVNQQVTCTVLYSEETYMTVIVDLKHDKVQVQGDVNELGDLSMDKDAYIDMFKHWTNVFIDNDISNPSEYFDEIIKNQS